MRLVQHRWKHALIGFLGIVSAIYILKVQDLCHVLESRPERVARTRAKMDKVIRSDFALCMAEV
jgi:hypothetical protein